MSRATSDARRRITHAATGMARLWGDGLPPGDGLWENVATDLTHLDDEFGSEQGFLVQGDALTVTALAQVLALVPAFASVRLDISSQLRERLETEQRGRDPRLHWRLVAQRVLESAASSLRTDGAAVFRRDGDSCVLEAQRDCPDPRAVVGGRIPLGADTLVTQAIRAGVPVRGVRDIGEPGREDAYETAAFPLPSRSARVPSDGALVLAWRRGPDRRVPPAGHLEEVVAIYADELGAALGAIPSALGALDHGSGPVPPA